MWILPRSSRDFADMMNKRRGDRLHDWPSLAPSRRTTSQWWTSAAGWACSRMRLGGTARVLLPLREAGIDVAGGVLTCDQADESAHALRPAERLGG